MLKKKKKNNVWEGKEKKERKKEEATCTRKHKKEKEKKELVELLMCNNGNAHGHFRPLSNLFSPFSFLSILGRKLFDWFGEKTLRPHHLFSFLSIQLNTLQKISIFYFLSKVFHLPYFTSKQTHPKTPNKK